MRAHVYESIDEIGAERLASLPLGLDFSFGLLRAVELSIWGDLIVRYITVESSSENKLLAFAPCYLGSNLNCNALLPKFIQRAYYSLLDGLGTSMATRVAIIGCLISDRGWIPMHEELTDRKQALQLMCAEMDALARQHRAQLGMIKDIHCDFPAEDFATIKACGFGVGLSLPTIRINTAYSSFEEYVQNELSKNGRKHARKQFRKAEGIYYIRVVEDFEEMLPQVLALYRAVFLKAKFQFEELTPQFFVESSRSTDPLTEMLICETAGGRIVGSMLSFYNSHEQQNKRIGIDYTNPDSGLVYNLLNYTGIKRAIERGIGTLWLGQSSYLVKTRLGGVLDDQYVFIKAYDPVLRPTLPLQRWWMSRYSAAKIQAGLENGGSPLQ